jgi:alpha-methylacyl-CoA racemase
LNINPDLHSVQHDRKRWPELRAEFERIFKSRSREEWTTLLEGTDTCFAPVLALSEATTHPHNLARQAFIDIDGVKQPAPAPRFSRTPSIVQGPPPESAINFTQVLDRWS